MDRIDAMKTYIAVVQEGSFSRAAEKLDMSPQLVSKYVSQLESHLGTRLLNRTTRRVHTTEAGAGYAQRAQQVLADIDDIENELSNLQRTARGILRINAPVSFAIQHLAGLLTDFQKRYADVQVDLQLNDRKVNIVDEGFDIALRIGNLKDSSLIAKRLAPIRLVSCAAPAYLASHGTPRHPSELSQHRYLSYSYMDEEITFRRRTQGQTPAAFTTRALKSTFIVNNGDVLTQAAIAGAGIIIQPTFITGPAIAAGKLTPVLEDYELEPLALYAVYAHRQLLSSKVRCFIDFIGDYFGDPPHWDSFDHTQAGS
jgi:DNA-binding transcriptional LysR family regulator